MASVPDSLKEMTPAPTSALVAGLGLTTANTKANVSASPLSTYNPRKDVSGSTAAALSAMSPKFWGASGGGYTTCHTTFVPDLVLPGSSSASSPSSSSSAYASPLSTASNSPYAFARANLNPLLNDKKPMEISSPPASTVALGRVSDGSDLSDSFDNWSADTGFTWNNLDAYRMQLWSRMARDASLARQGVPTDMRPKFLRESSLGHHHKTSMSVTEALSPTAPGPAPPTYRESHDDPHPSITQIIQHTISTSLFSSFLNALKAPQPAAGGCLDSDKIADIVQGRAALGVVPAEPPAYTEKQAPSRNTFDVDAELALAMSLNNLKLATENIARSKSQDVAPRRVGATA